MFKRFEAFLATMIPSEHCWCSVLDDFSEQEQQAVLGIAFLATVHPSFTTIAKPHFPRKQW